MVTCRDVEVKPGSVRSTVASGHTKVNIGQVGLGMQGNIAIGHCLGLTSRRTTEYYTNDRSLNFETCAWLCGSGRGLFKVISSSQRQAHPGLRETMSIQI